MGTKHSPNPEGIWATLADRQEPMAASTDGQVRDGAARLADRLAAVRGQAGAAGDQGSCPWTGWES
jgi:hypothetical protein